jgi:hypothetical protein
MHLLVPVPAGELLDKISILEIKLARIGDAGKRENVARELEALREVRERELEITPQIAALCRELQAVNETLWDVEDAIREHERRRCFDEQFIELARSVYRRNDQRAALKRRITALTGSPLLEEKSYTPYD